MKPFFLILANLFFVYTLLAQVPQKFNYQGVARTEQGDPIKNQNLKLKIAVLPTDDATVSEYEEIQTVKTNEFGLYSLQIGNGEAVLGDMKTVKWETGNKYIRVAIDPKGGNDFTVIGTSQLLSVPYAIYADKAGLARETVGGHTGDTRSGAVSTSATGTGTVNYLTKFTAANTIYNSQIFDNGTNIGIGTATPLSRMHITTSAGNQEHLRMENLSSTSWGKFIFYNDVNANYHTFTKYGSAVAGNYGGASTLFPYANLLVFGSNNSPTVMANGHNIGFATVNGGTAYFKFIGMQSTGNVGLGGNATPATSIHINRTDANGDTLKITNNTTGHTATDGLDIRVTGNAAQIIHRENSSLSIGTNNGIAITVAPSNNVGIGTANPGAALDVNGQLKIQGGSPGIGKVLTSDASGIGTWITPSITSAVGTANYLPRFGASGNTLVNSSLIDYNNVLLYNSLSAPSNFTGIHFKLKGNGNGNHLLLEGQKITSFTFFSAIDSGSGRKGFLAGQSSSFYVYNDSSVLLAYDPATQITSLSSNGINYNGLAIHNISGRIGNGSWLSYPSDIGNAHFNINSTYDTAANFTSSSPNLLGNGILRSEYNGITIADHVAINGVSKPAANYGIGVKGEGGYYGVFGMTDANGTAGVYGLSAGNVNGVYGRSNTGNGVYGTTTTGNGVMGTVNPLTAGVATGGRFLGKQTGVYGQADSASLQQTFVWGLFSGFKEAVGVHGYSNMNSTGNTFSNVGLAGSSWSNSYINFGTITEAQGGSYNYGIYAYAPSAPGVNYAGYFGGDVHVSGTLSKSGGTFKIDHPVDPENKYLIHSFVESPDMMNVYNGNIITDANGYATVELPSYFEAENKEYKYQLTVIDPSADFIFAKVTSEVSNNRFTIRTSKPDVKVSWQVTGVRKDPWANANRVVAEVDKSENDKGYYLNPELYGKPATQTVGPKKPNAHASSTINFPERRFENDLLNVVEKEHEERNKAVKAQYKSQPARKAETIQQASIGK